VGRGLLLATGGGPCLGALVTVGFPSLAGPAGDFGRPCSARRLRTSDILGGFPGAVSRGPLLVAAGRLYSGALVTVGFSSLPSPAGDFGRPCSTRRLRISDIVG